MCGSGAIGRRYKYRRTRDLFSESERRRAKEYRGGELNERRKMAEKRRDWKRK